MVCRLVSPQLRLLTASPRCSVGTETARAGAPRCQPLSPLLPGRLRPWGTQTRWLTELFPACCHRPPRLGSVTER